MDPIEAVQLFSWHAFKRNEPHQYSRELTNAIVSYTKGIPSALVKLGSVLSSKYVSYQHCEVDGENKQVGEMRNLVWKKLNKMFKPGQWGADSTGRLDKTLKHISGYYPMMTPMRLGTSSLKIQLCDFFLM